MKTKRYYGSFLDLRESKYLIEIWQEGEFEAEEVFFSSDPVEIEWKEREKLDPIYSSKATIRLLSKSDRKFTDLYTREVKTVRLDIYKDGSLYWSGTLDTELYEEPYDHEDGYAVSLTFSDFSVWKRIDYASVGFRTLKELFEEAIGLSGISFDETVYDISTTQAYGVELLDNTAVISDNFYDEDGEPDTYEKLMEHVLAPIGAFVVQRNGKVIVTDINKVYDTDSTEIRWRQTGSSLSCDKAYNKAVITLSTYEEDELLDAEITEDEFPSPSTTGGIKINTSVDSSTSALGFVIKFDSSIKNDAFELDEKAGGKFFSIKSVFSGDDDKGIMYTCKPLDTQYGKPAVNAKNSNTALFTVKKKPYIGKVSDSSAYKLRVTLDMMADVRYNPFETAEVNNEEGNWARLQNWANFGYVPVKITLRNAEGTALYHYSNKNILESDGYKGSASWLSGEASWGEAYLCYYDATNRKSSSGFGGWATNRQIIGYYRGTLPALYTKREDGEYISMPPAAGWLEVQVGVGFYAFDYKREELDKSDKNLYDRIRWLMYRNVSIDITDQFGISIEKKDVKLTAWIDRAAEDKFELETHVGTMSTPTPSARGVFFDNSDKSVLKKLERNSVTDTCEKLLAGTVYSQFGRRRDKITGTVELIDGFAALTDSKHDGLFMETSCLQNLRDSSMEITMIEIDKDYYEGVEFE